MGSQNFVIGPGSFCHGIFDFVMEAFQNQSRNFLDHSYTHPCKKPLLCFLSCCSPFRLPSGVLAGVLPHAFRKVPWKKAQGYSIMALLPERLSLVKDPLTRKCLWQNLDPCALHVRLCSGLFVSLMRRYYGSLPERRRQRHCTPVRK